MILTWVQIFECIGLGFHSKHENVQMSLYIAQYSIANFYHYYSGQECRGRNGGLINSKL